MFEILLRQSVYRPLTFFAPESVLDRIWARMTSRGKAGIMNNNDSRVGGAREDDITGAIESRTSQIPSSAYLGAALGSMAAAAILRMAGKKHASLFVGQWAAPFLLMGVYNKMVKQHGSDAETREAAQTA
jgi:hypothetical protein